MTTNTSDTGAPQPSPMCPIHKLVMVEQFDYHAMSERAMRATPNGSYTCLKCDELMRSGVEVAPQPSPRPWSLSDTYDQTYSAHPESDYGPHATICDANGLVVMGDIRYEDAALIVDAVNQRADQGLTLAEALVVSAQKAQEVAQAGPSDALLRAVCDVALTQRDAAIARAERAEVLLTSARKVIQGLRALIIGECGATTYECVDGERADAWLASLDVSTQTPTPKP